MSVTCSIMRVGFSPDVVKLQYVDNDQKKMLCVTDNELVYVEVKSNHTLIRWGEQWNFLAHFCCITQRISFLFK